jgi:hypothetical protein
VIGERAGGREGVLDRRQLLHLLRRLGTIAVVEVVAEEIFVVLVVPGVGLIGLLFGLSLLLGLGGFGRLELLGGDLLQHRIFHHFLIQEI